MTDGGRTEPRRLSRREFLKKTAAAGVSLSVLGGLLGRAGVVVHAASGSVARLTWISPRGTLEVMDDYNLWVAQKMGYFEQMGLEVVLEPGPLDALAVTRFVAAGQADVGYPSPGVLTASIDSGMPVISIWGMMMTQVFNFALPLDSPISDPRQLRGKTIALGSEGWQVIVDPMLVELGIDPKEVRYLNAGAQWGQAVALGQADAALSWEGLRAQWNAQGLRLKYLIGSEWSKHPSNVYAARRADLQDPARRDALVRFLKANVMALEFAQANPRAAAQITYEQFPGLAQQMTPQVALESMRQLAYGYAGAKRAGKGWGYHDPDGWRTYLDTLYELGQTRRRLANEEVFTNELVAEANSVDVSKARADAANFRLNSTWAQVTVEGEF